MYCAFVRLYVTRTSARYIATLMKQSFAGQLRLEPATDLHTHTTCSDGSLSPQDLVRKACEYQISVLGICDHDTTEALEIATQLSVHTPVDVLPGCELTCAESGKEFHLLAYCFDATEDSFQRYLAGTRQLRVDRCQIMLERLRGIDVDIHMDDVLRFAGGASIVRPHIAQALIAKGYVQSTQEAFDKYLSNHGPVYVPIPDQTLDNAIKVIHNAGGIAVIAHPARNIQTSRIVELIAAGLDGVETFYPKHTRQQTRYYHSLVKSYGLLATGGSDFHGNRPFDDQNFGGFSVELSTIDTMRSVAQKYR